MWPWWVWKSTIGPLLAEKLWYNVIDVDDVYLQKYGNITQHVKEIWYEYYTQNNTVLFNELLHNWLEQTVVVLSGWFIWYYPYEKLSSHGVCVTLLPYDDYEKSISLLLDRQSSRDFFIDMSEEEEKTRRRVRLYQNKWDIMVYTDDRTPMELVDHICSELQKKTV